METLTSIALARELNVLLRDTYVAAAEQAEGNTLLLHLRPPLRGRTAGPMASPHSGVKAAFGHPSRERFEPAPYRSEGEPAPGDTTCDSSQSTSPVTSPAWLVLSSCSGESTLFLANEKPESLGTTWPAPISRHLEGKRIGSVSNNGLDRILCISFAGPGGSPVSSGATSGSPWSGRPVLHIEMLTGRPRAVLVDEVTNLVVEAFPSRRGGGGRDFTPGEQYERPARPGGKLDPWGLDAAALEKALGTAPSEEDLVRDLFGVGRNLAREVQIRCVTTGKTPAGELKDLISQAAETWVGGYVLAAPGRRSAQVRAGEPETAEAGTREQPAEEGAPERAPEEATLQEQSAPSTRDAIPPRALTYKPSSAGQLRVTPYPTVNEAVREAFFLCREMVLERGRRRGAAREIRTELGRVARTHQALVRELEEAKGAAEIRHKGELILAHMTAISKGQTSVELAVSGDSGPQTVRIPLEARLSPADNAAVYFKRAKKLEKKLSSLPERIEKLSRREARLRDGLEKAELGPMTPSPSGALRPGRRAESRPAKWPTGVSPRRFTSSDGWTMYVGRNNKENDYITFVLAKPDDLWFHAQGVSGSHVILRREGRKDKPSRRCIEETASVAAYFSKGRTSQTVPVIYTEKRYVRKPRKAKSGTALYSNEKTAMVGPGLPSAPVE